MPWLIPMQYTGCNDKQGWEKFEDDIVRDNYGQVYRIIWEETEPGFVHLPISEIKVDIEDHKLWREPSTEIIGNAHENPELLGKEEHEN